MAPRQERTRPRELRLRQVVRPEPGLARGPVPERGQEPGLVPLLQAPERLAVPQPERPGRRRGERLEAPLPVPRPVLRR